MPQKSYCKPWEMAKKEYAKKLEAEKRERERRKLAIFTPACPYNVKYHYQLSIDNKVLNIFYEDTIRRKKLGHPPFSDDDRVKWEQCLWSILRKHFMKYDRRCASEFPAKLPQEGHITIGLVDWKREGFELFVNNELDVPTALQEFARKEAKIEYGKCGDKEVRRA